MTTQTATAQSDAAVSPAEVRERLAAEQQAQLTMIASFDSSSETIDPDVRAHGLTAARKRLAEVHAALVRLEDGNYGRCEHCSQMIAAARLEYMPHVRYCIDCQGRADVAT